MSTNLLEPRLRNLQNHNEIFELYENNPCKELKRPFFNFGHFIKDFIAIYQSPPAPKRDLEGHVITDYSKDLLIIHHLALQKLFTYSSTYREIYVLLSRHQWNFGQSPNDLSLLYELGSALGLSSNLFFETTNFETTGTSLIDYLKKIEQKLNSDFFPFLLSITSLLKFSNEGFQPLVDKALELSAYKRDVQFQKVSLFLEHAGLKGKFPVGIALKIFSTLALDDVIGLGEKSRLFIKKNKTENIRPDTLQNLWVCLSHNMEVLNEILLEIESVDGAFDFNSKVNITKVLLSVSSERRGTIFELIKRINKGTEEIFILEQLFLFLAKQEIDFEELTEILRLSHEARMTITHEYLEEVLKLPKEARTIYSLTAFNFPPDIRAEATEILPQIDRNVWGGFISLFGEFISLFGDFENIFPQDPKGYQSALTLAKEFRQPDVLLEILHLMDEEVKDLVGILKSPSVNILIRFYRLFLKLSREDRDIEIDKLNYFVNNLFSENEKIGYYDFVKLHDSLKEISLGDLKRFIDKARLAILHLPASEKISSFYFLKGLPLDRLQAALSCFKALGGGFANLFYFFLQLPEGNWTFNDSWKNIITKNNFNQWIVILNLLSADAIQDVLENRIPPSLKRSFPHVPFLLYASTLPNGLRHFLTCQTRPVLGAIASLIPPNELSPVLNQLDLVDDKARLAIYRAFPLSARTPMNLYFLSAVLGSPNPAEDALLEPRELIFSLDYAMAVLQMSLPPALIHIFSTFLIRQADELGLREHDPLFLLALEKFSVTDPKLLKDPKNPIRRYQRHLRNASPPFPPFTPPPANIEGKRVAFNLELMRQRGVPIIYTSEDIDPSISLEGFSQELEQLGSKISQSDAATAYFRDAVPDQVTYEQLKNRFMDNFTGSLFKEKNSISHPKYYLFQIIKAMRDLSEEQSSDRLLSEREEYLLKLLVSVQFCKSGKSEGLSLFFRQLDKKYKKFDYYEMYDDRGEAETLLHAEVQDLIEEVLSSRQLLVELIGESNISKETEVHDTVEAKNTLAPLIGFRKGLSYDPHGVIDETMLQKTREEYMEAFFKLFTPQILIEHLKKRSIKLFAGPKFSAGVVALLGDKDPSVSAHHWISFDTHEAGELKDQGVLNLLEHLGYLTPDLSSPRE